MARRYWLTKSEPNKYPFDQLVADGRTRWDGVRNFEARNNLRAMKKGDLVLYYHSNEGKAVVGVASRRARGVPQSHIGGRLERGRRRARARPRKASLARRAARPSCAPRHDDLPASEAVRGPGHSGRVRARGRALQGAINGHSGRAAAWSKLRANRRRFSIILRIRSHSVRADWRSRERHHGPRGLRQRQRGARLPPASGGLRPGSGVVVAGNLRPSPIESWLPARRPSSIRVAPSRTRGRSPRPP